jgi:hypothetical protein
MLSDSISIIQTTKAFAKRTSKSLRVSASSVVNVHFLLDHVQEERVSFDVKFFGNGKILVWGRTNWDFSSAIMSSSRELSSIKGLVDVLNSM